MFNLGTNIVIVASSLVKGETGPRTGSFGFALESSNDNLRQSSVYNRSLSTLFSPEKIMFTSFGNDSKLRIEEKTVMCALPIPLYNSNFNKHLDKMLISIKHGGLYNKKWKDAVHYTFKRSSIPICIVIPNVRPVNLTDCDITIFKAWLKTILKAPRFSDHLFRTLSQFSYIKKNTNIINFLIKKRNNLEFFDDDDETLQKFRKNIVRTVALLKTINVQHTFNKQKEDINKALTGQKPNKEMYAKIFSNILFSPMFDELYNNITRSDILVFMNNIAVLKSRLISLSPRANKT